MNDGGKRRYEEEILQRFTGRILRDHTPDIRETG